MTGFLNNGTNAKPQSEKVVTQIERLAECSKLSNFETPFCTESILVLNLKISSSNSNTCNGGAEGSGITTTLVVLLVVPLSHHIMVALKALQASAWKIQKNLLNNGFLDSSKILLLNLLVTPPC